MPDKVSPEVLAGVGVGAGLMGFGWRLYLGLPIWTRQTIGSIILSIGAGIIGFLSLHSRFAGDTALLCGVSLLLGVGGANIFEILMGVLAKSGSRIAQWFFDRFLGGIDMKKNKQGSALRGLLGMIVLMAVLLSTVLILRRADEGEGFIQEMREVHPKHLTISSNTLERVISLEGEVAELKAILER